MLLCRKRELLHVLQVLGIQSSVQTCIRCKNTKGRYWKQLNKNTLLLYGKLLETKKERENRQKLEEKLPPGSLTVSKDMNVDTELAWIRRVSRKKYFRRIIKAKPLIKTNVEENLSSDHAANDDREKIENTVASKGRIRIRKIRSKDTKSVFKGNKEICGKDIESESVNVESCNESKNHVDDSSVSMDLSSNQSSSTNGVLKSSLLPDIVVQNIRSFSIFDSIKKSMPEVHDRSKVLSISQYDDKESRIFPSVTRILSATMSEQAKLNLEMWKRKLIKELGEEGFLIYQKELLQNGKLLHTSIQNALTQIPFDIPDQVRLSFKSVEGVLKDITSVMGIETHVVHPKLRYRGIVDCIALYRGNPCVIDWKKSDKPKATLSSTYDAPLQVASYIGASNADKNYPFEIKTGVIVVAYTNGDVASVHEISSYNLEKYWKYWLKRLQEYYVGLKQCDPKSENK